MNKFTAVRFAVTFFRVICFVMGLVTIQVWGFDGNRHHMPDTIQGKGTLVTLMGGQNIRNYMNPKQLEAKIFSKGALNEKEATQQVDEDSKSEEGDKAEDLTQGLDDASSLPQHELRFRYAINDELQKIFKEDEGFYWVDWESIIRNEHPELKDTLLFKWLGIPLFPGPGNIQDDYKFVGTLDALAEKNEEEGSIPYYWLYDAIINTSLRFQGHQSLVYLVQQRVIAAHPELEEELESVGWNPRNVRRHFHASEYVSSNLSDLAGRVAWSLDKHKQLLEALEKLPDSYLINQISSVGGRYNLALRSYGVLSSDQDTKLSEIRDQEKHNTYLMKTVRQGGPGGYLALLAAIQKGWVQRYIASAVVNKVGSPELRRSLRKVIGIRSSMVSIGSPLTGIAKPKIDLQFQIFEMERRLAKLNGVTDMIRGEQLHEKEKNRELRITNEEFAQNEKAHKQKELENQTRIRGLMEQIGQLKIAYDTTKAELVSVEDALICPVCREVYAEPVSTPCGHQYCKVCITEWVNRDQTCPGCRQPIRSHDLIPLHNMKIPTAARK